MVQLTGELGPVPERMVDLWRLDELRGIALDGDSLVLGALTTFTRHPPLPAVPEVIPALVEAAATIGAAQIQNRATIGGNAMNASPAGDSLPVLLAADAEFVAGSRAANGRSRRARSGSPTARRRSTRTSCSCGSASRWCRGVSCASARSGRAEPRRSARSCSRSRAAIRAGRPLDDGPPRARVRGRPPIRAAATEAVLEGAEPDQATAGPRRRYAGRRAPADRRRPLDGRLPADGRGARAPPARARGRRLVIDLEAGPAEPFAAAVAPLFEGAPRFLARLAAARPVQHAGGAVRIGPRDRPRDARGGPGRADRRASASRRSARIGFGAVVRRAGLRPRGSRRGRRGRARPCCRRSRAASTPPTRRGSGSATACSSPAARAALLPGFEAALERRRDAELHRALDAVVDIAIDRHAKLSAEGPR